MQFAGHTRRRWRHASMMALGAAVALTALGCGGGGGGVGLGPAPAWVSGVVVDWESSQPLSGASVRSAGRSARTAADGSFRLGVETGIVTLSVSRTNYHTGTFTAETTAGQQVDLGTLALAHQNGAPPPPPFE